MEQLVKSGIATPIRTDEAAALLQAISTRCEMAGARLERLEAELTSAQDGVILGDGANDALYSQQQRDRLLLLRQELETKVLDESSRSLQIAAEMAEETERVDRYPFPYLGTGDIGRLQHRDCSDGKNLISIL